MVVEATLAALDDAKISAADVDAALYSHVFFQGASPGEVFLRETGISGVPILNVENACASGSSAIWQAFSMIRTGVADVVVVVGSERVAKGPVASTADDDPERLLGADHMMATYALRADEYIRAHGAPIEALANVAVKASVNRAANPASQYNEVYTVDDVLDSRVIASPLTLLQCCPTSEGAAAVVLTSDASTSDHDLVEILWAELTTDVEEPRPIHNMSGVRRAAASVWERTGLAPSDVDIVQVHDASTIGELLRLEALGLYEPGGAWRATLAGDTAVSGALPVNTDGGLLGVGHPFGATGIRQLIESVRQIQGRASGLQVESPEIGLMQCSGAGGVSTLIAVAGVA